MVDDALARIQEDISGAEEARRIDQGRAPVLEAIRAYKASGVTQFSIPAHKRSSAVDDLTLEVLGAASFDADIPLQKGLDDRRSTKHVLEHAQSLAAAAFGADVSLFSTNGSTLSVQLAITAAVRPGETLAVARNVHKSVVSAVVLSGAEPVWLDPAVDEDNAVAHGVTVDSVEAAFAAHPDIRAVLVVSPTYFGAAADIGGLAEVCPGHDVPLLVDDAWGALCHFHPDLPPAPLGSGADLSVSSYHKSLSSFMQGSIISVRGDRVELDRLRLLMDQFETTSASSLLLASMDGARRHFALHGRELLGETLRLAHRAAADLANLSGLEVFGEELVGRPGVAAFDPTKLTVDVRGIGVPGYEVADWLYENRRVAAELADHAHVMFLITTGDDDRSIDALIAAWRDFVATTAGNERLPDVPGADRLLAGAEYVMSPRDAFLGSTKDVKLGDAVGELAAEPVAPYPPGVPVLVPGQRVTAEIVEFLQLGLAEGMLVKGVTDPSLEQLRVVT